MHEQNQNLIVLMYIGIILVSVSLGLFIIQYRSQQQKHLRRMHQHQTQSQNQNNAVLVAESNPACSNSSNRNSVNSSQPTRPNQLLTIPTKLDKPTMSDQSVQTPTCESITDSRRRFDPTARISSNENIPNYGKSFQTITGISSTCSTPGSYPQFVFHPGIPVTKNDFMDLREHVL
jgi:type II secretory pathway pseudopilin PulG